MLEISSTMGEGIQEIIRLEVHRSSSSPRPPAMGALAPWPRPTFTSGQPYLMLLSVSRRRVTEQRCNLHSRPPGLLMNITDRLTEKLKTLTAGVHVPRPTSGFSGGWRPSQKVFSFTGLSLFSSVLPLITHEAGNGTSCLDCVTLSLLVWEWVFDHKFPFYSNVPLISCFWLKPDLFLVTRTRAAPALNTPVRNGRGWVQLFFLKL